MCHACHSEQHLASWHRLSYANHRDEFDWRINPMPVTSLPPELREFVDRQIAAGEFPDEDALVIEALRRMSSRQTQLEWERARIAEAYESVEREGWIDLDDEAWDKYFADLERQIDAPTPVQAE
jgi:putative addiction module CopG family antidote